MLKPETIDEYLSALSPDKRGALERLRKTIRAVAPNAEECISYQIPAFRLDGRVLVCFGAVENHCALYPGSAETVAEFREDLKGYDTSKGTFRFAPNKPLPVALVRKLVKARMKEHAQRSPARARAGTVRRVASDPEVAAFIRAIDHPMKKEMEGLRRLILGASPKVTEGIKWNAPSFRTTEWFATMNVTGRSSPACLRIILHLGAKPKPDALKRLKIADSSGLLEWLGKDRGMVTFRDGKDFKAKSAAMKAIVKQWVKAV
jgi:uncharacterized protein YdhG (YjbR/CyaY superfamily)